MLERQRLFELGGAAPAEDLGEISKLIEAGKVKPIVTETMPLVDAPKANDKAATHHTRGKIVLKVADEPKT